MLSNRPGWIVSAIACAGVTTCTGAGCCAGGAAGRGLLGAWAVGAGAGAGVWLEPLEHAAAATMNERAILVRRVFMSRFLEVRIW